MITPLIKVNDVDVTAVVRYSDALFVSQVNGIPGSCLFAVRDLQHNQAFSYGQTITLDIDAERRWTGFVQKVKRQYTAPVVDTTEPAEVARWFVIEGVDINVLFQKRVVYNPSTPTKMIALPPPAGFQDSKHADQWEEDSPSDEVVKYVIEHYTDLLDDGVTLGGVENLGSPNPDWAGAYAGAQTVGDFMRSVNKLLGGIWYLKPDFEMVHRFVEVATTDKFLSDFDDGDPDFVGPRNYSFTSDASAMVNDALVWGTAPGVSSVRFSRVTDADSRDLHGRWQTGEFNSSMYKQASLDQRAEALVYGNDASRHGAKDDRLVCEATIFTPDFYLGDVVTCKSYVFEEGSNQLPPFEDTEVLTAILPVRRIVITFPTPTSAKFDLLLTQELDEPWSIYEAKWPKLRFPTPGFPGIPLPDLPPPGGGVGPCDCGQMDDFQREVAEAYPNDTASSGMRWNVATTGNSVSGGVLTMTTPANFNSYVLDDNQIRPTSDIYLTCQITAFSGTPGPNDIIFFGADTDPDFAEIDFSTDGTLVLYTGASGADSTTMPFGPDQKFKMRLNAGGTNARCKVWLATDPEPSGWTLEWPFDVPSTVWDYDTYFGVFADDPPMTVTWENMVSAENTRCAVAQFDTFDGRAVSDGWGITSPSGYPWSTVITGVANPTTLNAAYSVFNSFGQFNPEETPSDDGVIYPVGFVPPAAFELRAIIQMLDTTTESDFYGSWQAYVASWDGGPYDYHGVGFDISDDSVLYVISGGADEPGDVASVDLGDLTGEWGTRWNLHMRVEGGRIEASVWKVGDTEPSSYMVQSGDTAHVFDDPVEVFYIFNPNIGQTIRTYDLDIITDDRPCYLDCVTGQVTSLFDNFNRTDNTNPPNMGTTPSGYVWPASSPIGTISTMGLNGNQWFQQKGINWNRVVPPRGGGADLWSPVIWSMRVRFRITGTPTSSSPYRGATFILGPHTTGQIVIVIDDRPWDDSGFFGGVVKLGGGGFNMGPTNSYISKDDWTANTWYIVEYLHDSVSDRKKLRVWEDGDPVPAYMLDKSVPTSPIGHTVEFGFLLDTYASTDPAWEVQVDNIEFEAVGLICDEVPPPESSGLPMSGFVCETLEHSGGEDFAASRAFVGGSLEIYINGLRLTTGYTYDAPLGEIHLTTGIDAADVLRICYVANGVPI